MNSSSAVEQVPDEVCISSVCAKCQKQGEASLSCISSASDMHHDMYTMARLNLLIVNYDRCTGSQIDSGNRLTYGVAIQRTASIFNSLDVPAIRAQTITLMSVHDCALTHVYVKLCSLLCMCTVQNVHAKNEEGNTPLHWACLNGHAEVSIAYSYISLCCS